MEPTRHTERAFGATAAVWLRHIADKWKLLQLDTHDADRLTEMAKHCEDIAYTPPRVTISVTVRTDLDPADLLDHFHTWLDEMREADEERCDTTAAKERCESLWEDAKDTASVEYIADDAPDPLPF